MRRNRKRTFLILIVSLALVGLLSISYALFSPNAIVDTSTTSLNSFNIEFNSVSTEVTDNTTTATISSDRNSLFIEVKDLSQPGAISTTNVIVKNVGNIPAVLEEILISGDDSNENISVTVPDPDGRVMYPGDILSFPIIVKWENDSTTLVSSLDFQFDLIFTQGEIE